jgi:hypothetical protein
MYSLPNFGALSQHLAKEFERSHGTPREIEESRPDASGHCCSGPRHYGQGAD